MRPASRAGGWRGAGRQAFARLRLAARFHPSGGPHSARLRLAARPLRDLALAALVAAACGGPAQPPAPTLPRAVVVLEPTQIGVADVATLEIAIATPPDWAPRPLALPEAPAGLWILGVESLPAEREATRWLHRTRVHVRAREVGSVTWPASVVEFEAPGGAIERLATPPLAIEVVSVLPEYPERAIPFGVREPPERERGGSGALLGAAAGAGAVLAGLAAARVRAHRRARRAGSASAPPGAPPPEPPWETARAALAQARALAPREPFEASDLAARALRRYAGRRFAIGAEARTSEELAAAPAPFAASTRWPLLVASLRALDLHRFRPRGDPEARAALATGLPGALALAERFVEETLPPGGPA